MSDRPNPSRSVSAAGVHRQDWADLARSVRSAFNERGRAAENAAARESADGHQHRHDREPPLDDKKRGAELDRLRSSQSDYAARKARFRSRDNDLGLGR